MPYHSLHLPVSVAGFVCPMPFSHSQGQSPVRGRIDIASPNQNKINGQRKAQLSRITSPPPSHPNAANITNLTAHEQTRSYKWKIAILDNAHLKVQTLCYFMLKSDLPNGDKITSV